jgi:CHAT domain-containing protein/lipopolysaccharide biosynthesis regulator YciM
MLVACLAALAPHVGAAAGVAGNDGSAFAHALAAYQRGALEDAALHFTEAARAAERERKPGERSLALTSLAQVHQELGQQRVAISILEQALELVRASGQRDREPFVRMALGRAYAQLGHFERAREYLQDALQVAHDTGAVALSAAVLNDLGHLATREGKLADSIGLYRRSLATLRPATDPALAAAILTNLAIALREVGEAEPSRATLEEAAAEASALPVSRESAYRLITIAVTYMDLRRDLPAKTESLRLRAAGILSTALAMAQQLGDSRSLSYALGHLGAVYEEERRYEEALALTRRAVQAGQQRGAPESLYRWHWQTGRLLRQLARTTEAIDAYRLAIRALQSLRAEMAASGTGRPFREGPGRAYTELIDLLLQRSGSSQTAARAADLTEARQLVELAKVAELRDYFRDGCVDAIQRVPLDVVTRAAAQTAVIVYPILLLDRIELLVTLANRLERITVPVGADELAREVREFRERLESPSTLRFLPHARRLYDWLIRPMEPLLVPVQLDTLVFVPDGPLRTIPMAALHDGRQFLVSRYAVATTPGLSLTEPRSLRRDSRVLALGLSEPRTGEASLPGVAVELREIAAAFQTTTLVNRDFTVANVERSLKEQSYAIIHMASHGQFAGDARQSFVSAYDEAITMDRLEQLVSRLRFREEPLELLTLSACQSAHGDDRAALGIAGIAVKAGARSALATLWRVDDDATATLMAEFYRQLQQPGVSRATALQHAQSKLVQDPRYDHPFYWAAFLLISNWL